MKWMILLEGWGPPNRICCKQSNDKWNLLKSWEIMSLFLTAKLINRTASFQVIDTYPVDPSCHLTKKRRIDATANGTIDCYKQLCLLEANMSTDKMANKRNTGLQSIIRTWNIHEVSIRCDRILYAFTNVQSVHKCFFALCFVVVMISVYDELTYLYPYHKDLFHKHWNISLLDPVPKTQSLIIRI